MTRREVDDLFIVRGALEGLAVRLATPTLQNDASKLLAIQAELDTAETRNDLVAMSRQNLAFHMLFADVTGNALYVNSCDGFPTVSIGCNSAFSSQMTRFCKPIPGIATLLTQFAVGMPPKRRLS